MIQAPPVAPLQQASGAGPRSSSYIVCSRDRPDDLARCIRSILAQDPLPDELIIIDASVPSIASRNYEQATAALIGVEIEFHYRLSPRPSLPFQRNLGVDVSSGDLLFFLDDDVLLLPGFHRTMLDLWDAHWHAGVGGIQGSAINAPLPNRKGKFFRAIFMPDYSRRELAQRVHPSWYHYLRFLDTSDKLLEVEWMSGYTMSFKRQVFEHFRFDARLDGYASAEDADFSYRVSRKFRLLKAGSASVIHTSSSAARMNPRQFMEMWVVNRHYLFRKNIPQRKRYQIAYLWASCGILLRACFHSLRDWNAGYILGTLCGVARILRKDLPGAVVVGNYQRSH